MRRACDHCGVVFEYEQVRRVRFYCSRNCKCLASYYRKKEQLRAWRAKQRALYRAAGLVVPERLKAGVR